MRTETDHNGDIRTYNEHNKLVHVKYIEGLEIWFEYDEEGKDKSMHDSTGYRETFEYDANGGVTAHCSYKTEQWIEKWDRLGKHSREDID
jgi:YD repeat-containing protein